MCALKSDNDRLQRMVQSSQSLNNSQGSLLHHNRTSSESLERTISLSENTSIGKLSLLHLERPKLHGVLAVLSAIGLRHIKNTMLVSSNIRLVT